MTLRHLTIFQAVCQTESITQAAERLNMTQPAVSLAIRELEEFYGAQLFERMNRRIYLTDAGRTLWQYADTILSQYQESRQVLREARHTATCRFGVHVTFGETLLPALLGRLSQQLPRVAVRAFVTNTRENEEMLLRNQLDFAVIDNVRGLEALHTIPLGREPMSAVCRPDYRPDGPITLEQLAGERLLLREKGSGTRDSIDSVFGAAGMTISAFLDSSSTYAILHCAQQGLGVAILPRSLTAEALQAGRLKELTVTGGTFFRRYYLAHHKNKYLTDSVRQVIDLVRDTCRASGMLT